METTTDTQTTEPQASNRPAAKLRMGRLEASIWENAGERGITHSVTFERRYRDPETGEWKSSHSYRAEELFMLSALATDAGKKILELRAAAFQADRDTPS